LGLLTADHVIDDTRTLIGDWREVDVDVLTQLADDLEASATAKLELAGVDPSRRRYEWRLNLVYPGQTFDVAIPVEREIGAPFTRDSLAQAAEELHHRNEAARLIETRSQEPVVRGVRLVATGLVEQPTEAGRAAPGPARPVSHRRVYAGARWVDDTPVFHGQDLGAGSVVSGPALIQSPFTTVVLAEGDVATMLASGDLLVDVASL
jgi:N-methylhydantoinase A